MMFTSNWIEKNANDYEELISAINNGDANSVESILEKCSMSGWEANPLYVAVSCNNEKIKQMICDHYRKFDRYSMIVLKKIINDWNNFSASDKQIYEKIIYELTANNNHINQSNINGSMLAQACESGQIDIVKVLIKQGTNVNFLDKNSKTLPLHLAILKNHSLIVEELIKAGANVNMSDKDGNRSLHFASKSGNLNIVKTLVKHGASVACKNYNLNYTPLHTAVEKGHLIVVEELIKSGAKVDVSSKDGRSPLHIASELGNLEILEFLLANEADPNWKSSLDYTPLFSAVEKGHLAVVECLLKAKADINAFSVDGKTPLYVGLEFDRINIVDVLLDNGADVYIQENTKKFTLLHTAASYDSEFVIGKLIDMGVDINARDISGKTPLHIATHHGKKAMQSLLSLGADKSLEDYKGYLPFHDAIVENNFDAMDILFDANEARNSKIFHEVVDEVLKDCQCPSSCRLRSKDAINRVLMHLIKFEAVNMQIHNNCKLKLHKVKEQNYYNECLAEVEQLKDFYLINDNASLYDFLHKKPKRRLAFVERVPADLAKYKIYGCLIEDYANEAIERKSLFDTTKTALYALTNIFFPDICVERISDFMNIESLKNLSNV